MQIYTIHLKVANKSTGFFDSRVNKRRHPLVNARLPYSTDRRNASNLTTISAERANTIIEMNKRGEKPVSLEEGGRREPERPVDLATQEDLNRFDKKKRKKKHKNKQRNNDNRPE